MTQFEKLIIKKRTDLIKRNKRVFANAIRSQYMDAIDAIGNHSLDQIKDHIKQVAKKDPIEKAFKIAYPQAADIALSWRKKLLPTKDAVDDIYKNIFMRNLQNYAVTKAGKRITDITGTTQDRIESVVSDAMASAVDQGLGIAETRNLILSAMREDYDAFTGARANLIAQTEMITASNQATMEGAKSTGMGYRKFWSTSGIGNTRDSHMAAEEESIAKGGLMEDELFDSCPGMAFPGDPGGDAADICNCHCTLLIEITD